MSSSAHPLPDLDSVWAAASQMLRLEITEQQYFSYVDPARPLPRAASGEFRLAVPSEAAAEWMRAKAGRLDELVGRSHGLRVVVEVDQSEDLFSGEAPAAEPRAPARAAAGRRERPAKVQGLSSGMVFESFVRGESNGLAYAAAAKLASDPSAAATASPLFIHGAVGLGKTHLAHAIGNRHLHARPDGNLRLLSGEQFMREVQLDFTSSKIQEFRSRFRRLDLLIIDDIHLIGRDSEQTHKQLIGLFNHMQESGLPIVVTSDRPVRALGRRFPPQLVSRLEMGLSAEIHPPDEQTRIGILRTHARAMGHELPEEPARMIAARLTSNCRELIGAARRLFLRVEHLRRPPSAELAADVLREIAGSAPDLSPADIIEHVARHHGLRGADLRSKRRTKGLVRARHLAMHLCRELTDTSLPEIGQEFGCHHSSVIHALRKIGAMAEKSKEFAGDVSVLRKELVG